MKRQKEATSGAKLSEVLLLESLEGVEPDGLEREAEMDKQEGVDLEGEAAEAVVDVPLEGPERAAKKRMTASIWLHTFRALLGCVLLFQDRSR